MNDDLHSRKVIAIIERFDVTKERAEQILEENYE